MDNAITDLLAAIIPELGAMLADMRFWLGVAMLIGPILLVLLGAYYYFLAPGEANHKAGYRTYYGMGSVEAWRFTQGFAGKVWGFLGAGLAVAAIIGCIIMGVQDSQGAVVPGLIVLILEAVAVLTGFVIIETTVSRRFDKDGNVKK